MDISLGGCLRPSHLSRGASLQMWDFYILFFSHFCSFSMFYIHCRSRFCFHACKNPDNKCICKTTDVLLLSPRFQMVKKNHICWGLETSGRPSVSISSSSISDYMEMGHEEPNQSYNICAALFPIQKSLVVY